MPALNQVALRMMIRLLLQRRSQLAAFGRSLPVVTMVCTGQVECKRLVSGDAIRWSREMQLRNWDQQPSNMDCQIGNYLFPLPKNQPPQSPAQRNVELKRLTGRLAPDFETIADFHKNNDKAIRNLCRQFVVLCRN